MSSSTSGTMLPPASEAPPSMLPTVNIAVGVLALFSAVDCVGTDNVTTPKCSSSVNPAGILFSAASDEGDDGSW